MDVKQKALHYFRRICDKTLKACLPKKYYLAYSWNSGHWWFKKADGLEEHDIARPQYLDYVEAIGQVLAEPGALGIDAGAGNFRLTKYFSGLYPGAAFLGVDFYSAAAKECEKLKQRVKVGFIKSNLADTGFWVSAVNRLYPASKMVVFSYGVLMYLSKTQLTQFMRGARNLAGLKKIVIIEPTGGFDLSRAETIEKESYYHNYPMYFAQCGYAVDKSALVSGAQGKPPYIFVCARPQ